MSGNDIEALKRDLAVAEADVADAKKAVREKQDQMHEAEDRRNVIRERIQKLEEDRNSAKGLGDGELLAAVTAWSNKLRTKVPEAAHEDWGAFDELFDRYARQFCPRHVGKTRL